MQDISENFGITNLTKDNLGFHSSKYVRETYDPMGDYLSFSKLKVENWKIVQLDEHGIPKNHFRWGCHYYPITIAHYGLQLFGEYYKSLTINPVIYSGNPDIFKANDSSFELAGSLSDGVDFEGVSADDVEAIDISSQTDFRVHFDYHCNNGTHKVVVYNGRSYSEYKSRTLYLSLKKFKQDLILIGKGRLDNIKARGNVQISFDKSKLSGKVHSLNKAITVADWFLENQDESGAWLSDFEHVFYKGRTLPIKKNWPSALGQGLAVSFLARMYCLTKDERYKTSCLSALNPFTVTVEEGGVLNYWSSSLPWYEEYPTQPASFVLNGFIFSLLGLYDCWKIFDDSKAGTLYKSGLTTLLKTLPLFDLGNRSAYDLTHYTCKSFPNIARWGYHQTHINQLYALETITENSQIRSFRLRWERYVDEGFNCPSN